MSRRWIALSCIGLLSLACGPARDNDGRTGDGTPNPSPTPTSEPDGPQVLSLGVNVGEITEGESVLITAVVTDPDGVDDLIGGTLRSAEGVIYGDFAVEGGGGTYTIDLSWAEIDLGSAIEFDDEDVRSFVAEFYDAAGHKGSDVLDLRLHCDGLGAAEGQCFGITSGTYEITILNIAANECAFNFEGFDGGTSDVTAGAGTLTSLGVTVNETATPGTYAGSGAFTNDHTADFDCVEDETHLYDVVTTGPDLFEFRFRQNRKIQSGAECDMLGIVHPCDTEANFALERL